MLTSAKSLLGRQNIGSQFLLHLVTDQLIAFFPLTLTHSGDSRSGKQLEEAMDKCHNSPPEVNTGEPESLTRVAEQLFTWAKTLATEIENFREAVRERRGQVFFANLGNSFSQALRSEMVFTESLVRRAHALQTHSHDDSEEESKIRKQLGATNIPGVEVRWGAIKKCRGIVSMGRHFQISSLPGTRPSKRDSCTEPISVNAVVDDGARWLRILGTTERRLLLEMAAGGWDFGNMSEDDVSDSLTDEDGISVLRTVAELVEAARANPLRHNYACPRIHVILTRVDEGKNSDIDLLIRKMRQLGSHSVSVTVDCANSPFCMAPTPPFKAVVARLLPNEPFDLTPTINIDTSILVALASDTSHQHVTTEAWRSVPQLVEIRREHEEPGRLLSIIFDVIRGRRLVCTREAAAMLRDMTKFIATPTEIARAAILVPREEDGCNAPKYSPSQRRDLIQKLRHLSIHSIPDDLQLPIEVLDEAWGMERIQRAVKAGELPKVAERVVPEITTPTVSVFSYGWASGYMTITGNKAVRNQISHLIEQHKISDDERGPNVFAIGGSRSLHGKKKERDP